MTLDRSTEEWWRAERAVMKLCFGTSAEPPDMGPRSARALAVDLAIADWDGEPAVSDEGGQRRDESAAREILTGAIQSGEVRVSGRRAGESAAVVSVAEARHLVLRRDRVNPTGWKVEEGGLVLAAIDNGPDTTWYDLRLLAADVIRLAKRKSPHSLFYEPDEWRRVRNEPWLHLADAARLRMEMSNQDGERLALEIHSPRAEVDASPEAVDAWDRATREVLHGLRSGLIKAQAKRRSEADSGDVQLSAWQREAADWWRSALGGQDEILVWREDIEALENPAAVRAIVAERPASSQRPRLTAEARKEKFQKGIAWARARVAEGKRIPYRQFTDLIRIAHGINSTLAKEIWNERGVIPDGWKKRGPHAKSES